MPTRLGITISMATNQIFYLKFKPIKLFFSQSKGNGLPFHIGSKDCSDNGHKVFVVRKFDPAVCHSWSASVNAIAAFVLVIPWLFLGNMFKWRTSGLPYS